MVVRTILLALTFALGTLAAQARQDTPAAGNAAQSQQQPATSGAPLAVDPTTYVIGAQDVLNIKVWREQDFSGTYIVRPDGKITVPLIGDVQSAGITPEALADQLEKSLADYINHPDVSVTITQVNSKKYSITGEVNRPGEFPLVVPTKIFDALSNSGGFREFANKKKIVIIRGADRLKFNYMDVLKGKNLEQNILLENGDTVYVP